MDVIVSKESSTLQISYIKGTDQDGNAILTSRIYRSIRPETTDQNLYDCAVILAGLQEHLVNYIKRVDGSLLTE
jgi:hypothetical protein